MEFPYSKHFKPCLFGKELRMIFPMLLEFLIVILEWMYLEQQEA